MLNLLVVIARTGIDLDTARLHGLRHLAYQVDFQQTVLECCALDLHIICQGEHPPERPCRYALVEVLTITGFVLTALYRKHMLLSRNGDLVRREARNSQRDLILVLADPLDVVWRVTLFTTPAQRLISEVEKAFEPNGRAPQR